MNCDWLKTMKILFLFVDGVGLGKAGEENPFYNQNYKAFRLMSGGQPFTADAETVKRDEHFFKGVHANLNTSGLPQSGTGQTALFSGKNAAKVIGRHFGPWPHSKIKYLLEEESIFHKARQQGKSCHFINAYPEIFFKNKEKTNRWSCTTLMAKSAGLELNGSEQVKNEESITAGITQQAWRERLGIDVPLISPRTAAQRLLKQMQKYNLLLHEYYLTDKAGHSKSDDKAEESLTVYNEFLWTIVNEKPDDMTVVLCSDHGNIENVSIKTHTRNKVPLFVYGHAAQVFFEATSILDVVPAIVELLDK